MGYDLGKMETPFERPAVGGERVGARAYGTSARMVMFTVSAAPGETLVDWARRVVTELRLSGVWRML